MSLLQVKRFEPVPYIPPSSDTHSSQNVLAIPAFDSRWTLCASAASLDHWKTFVPVEELSKSGDPVDMVGLRFLQNVR